MPKKRKDKGIPRGPQGRRRIRVYGDQIPDDQIDLDKLARALLAAARANLATQPAKDDGEETKDAA